MNGIFIFIIIFFAALVSVMEKHDLKKYITDFESKNIATISQRYVDNYKSLNKAEALNENIVVFNNFSDTLVPNDYKLLINSQTKTTLDELSYYLYKEINNANFYNLYTNLKTWNLCSNSTNSAHCTTLLDQKFTYLNQPSPNFTDTFLKTTASNNKNIVDELDAIRNTSLKTENELEILEQVKNNVIMEEYKDYYKTILKLKNN